MSDTLEPTVERLRHTLQAVADQVADAPPEWRAGEDTSPEGTVILVQHPLRDRIACRRWVLGAAAVAATILIAAAVLLQGDGRDDVRTEPAGRGPTPTTAPPPTTTVQLLPEGPPSAPSTGELVATINIRHRGVFRLYADGRLIDVWDLTERRLTPEGVERVRARFLSSGLFDSAQPLSEIDELCPISACVREGDRWLHLEVDVGGPSASMAPPEAVQLFDDLVNLELWLPATEWADQQTRPYVPGLIGTCLSMSVDGASAPLDLAVLLSQLPEQAAGVLAAHEPSGELEGRLLPLTRFDGTSSYTIMPGLSDCFELTLDEARTLAAALLAPSGGGTHEDGITVTLGLQPDPSRPGSTREEAAQVWFFRLLPDKWPHDVFGD